jgi:hypothetical protein
MLKHPAMNFYKHHGMREKEFMLSPTGIEDE